MQQEGKIIDSGLNFVGKAWKLSDEMRPTNFQEHSTKHISFNPPSRETFFAPYSRGKWGHF